MTRAPNEKTLDPLVPMLFIEAIHNRLREYDGTRIGDPRPCPNCESTDLRKNGSQKEPKTVARLITEDGFEEVSVRVQLYRCKECGRSFQGDISELFYEDCHYAKPIVNLCLFHAVKNPFNACERILHTMYGIQVDRETVQNYAEKFGDEFAEEHSVKIAGKPVSLNFLSFLFNVDSVEELNERFEDELAEEGVTGLVGVADETYPAKKGAKKELYEENMERKKQDEQERQYPESFTVGCGYLPQLNCFASLQCRNTGFPWALAWALLWPLEGVEYWVSDDDSSYNDVLPDRVLCVIHRLRNRARHDERVQELQEDGELEKLREYLQEEYESLYTEVVDELKEAYPSFWDPESESFTGPVSTNAIEGGNWRLKYGLGVPYARCQAARARTALLALRDSRSVFKNGRPTETFACRHSDAGFERVLGTDQPAGSSSTSFEELREFGAA